MRKHAMLLGVVLLGFVSALSYAQAPVPFINQPLIPDATAPGGPQFTLTVNGTGFVSNSVVNWNGSALATQFVSGSQLTAIVPAADIATANTGWVTVVNPVPGGGTSSVAFFTVTANTGNSVGFGAPSSLPTGSYPGAVVAADFNGDGKLDLATATCGTDPSCKSTGTASVFLGDGTGNFTLASSPVAGIDPYAIAVGDFNGDGKPDLAVGNWCGTDPTCNSPGTVSILLGDGTGNFTLASSPTVGIAPVSIAVADFNGDGKLDLAVANVCGDLSCTSPGTVSILLGDGKGNFQLASSPVVGNYAESVAAGDFNGDGKLDLAIANLESNTVSILLGDGTGNFTLASSPAVGNEPWSVVVADFNGDGKLDLATANNCPNCESTVSILLGDGAGNFTLASSPLAGISSISVSVADFNADGKPDLAVSSCRSVNCTAGAVSILLGDGTGNFTLESSVLAGPNASLTAVGDFNNDGQLDLAVASFESRGKISVARQGLTPIATVSPTRLNFGTQLVGTSSSPQPVTFTNSGRETLVITTIAATAHFSQTNNCPSSIPPNGQCVINVIFAPPFRGTFTGHIRITDNAPKSPQTVPLTGVGTAVSLLPSSLDFGNQKVGTASAPQPVTFTNHGIAAVNNLYIHFTGPNAAAFAQTNSCGTSVPAGGSCTISVTFTPYFKGQKTATLDVRDNGGASPQTVALSGTGTE